LVEAKVKKVYSAHYHRRAGGEYKGLEVVVTGALGTNLKTKEPDKKLTEIEKINFKITNNLSFGGLVTEENVSGLMVVTVTKKGLSDKWLTIKDIKAKIEQTKDNTMF